MIGPAFPKLIAPWGLSNSCELTRHLAAVQCNIDLATQVKTALSEGGAIAGEEADPIRRCIGGILILKHHALAWFGHQRVLGGVVNGFIEGDIELFHWDCHADIEALAFGKRRAGLG